MAAEENERIVKALSLDLEDKLSAEEMEAVSSAISKILDRYEIYEEGTQIDTESDEEMIGAFVSALRVEGRSEKTIERYTYEVRKLLKGARISTKAMTVYHIRRFLTEEKTRGISDRTLNGNRNVYNTYFGWLQREGLIEKNPVANIGPIKYQKKVKVSYSAVDLDRLKSSCKNIRDKAIICFLEATGCRISEMTGTNRENVDLERMECRVLGKGKKERVVYFDEVTGELLKEYLKSRTDDSEALFIGKGTRRLKPGGVRAMLVKTGKLANVEKVHPHKFRRTLATNLIKHGMKIQEVAAILGHERIDTTMQYVVMDQNQVKNAYQKYA